MKKKTKEAAKQGDAYFLRHKLSQNITGLSDSLEENTGFIVRKKNDQYVELYSVELKDAFRVSNEQFEKLFQSDKDFSFEKSTVPTGIAVGLTLLWHFIAVPIATSASCADAFGSIADNIIIGYIVPIILLCISAFAAFDCLKVMQAIKKASKVEPLYMEIPVASSMENKEIYFL